MATMTLDTSRILSTAGLTTAPGKPTALQSTRPAAPTLDPARLVSTKGLNTAAGKPV